MLKLMQNEWMKLWSKKASWIMVFLLILILFASAAITKYVNSTANEGIEETWQETTAVQLEANQAMLMDPTIGEEQKEYYEGQIAIAEHRLENDVQPFEFTSMQQGVIGTHEMLSLVTLFTVIVAAGITASEFSQGTIKMLLTRPVKRWKVLTSKYVTTMVFAVLMSIITLLATALAGLIFFGIGEGTFLQWNGSEVVEGSYWIEGIKLSILGFASVWMIGTFAFMLGTVFRSSSLAIGLSIFLMFTGIQAVFLLRNYEIVNYYLFTHTDLTQFYTGLMLVPDITMAMSLTVLAVYFLIFLAISYWTFSKRDITA
ncbi:ABC transporter permease [Planococcus sp. N028]|uniref:ABC transporter permease n=1 Tax=Planococcus shixiaomingii TaxID=3058393 RepID=A0ABT8N6B5_9BACL|nr:MULTISPECIES: ABC transporter permease [unclassified Planococcus (in: firmicutes)]MDN7243278.1 ABC transporter permease [Planococcus sp. N028]WKA55220.1 ABC transporter permease [Planococcus sp. N022]